MNDIDLVRQTLGPDGERWLKGALHNADHTRWCLIGAIEESIAKALERPEHVASCAFIRWAEERNDRVVRLCSALDTIIEEQYPDRHDDELDVIPGFNDHPATVWQDIEAVLDKAEAALSERV